MLSKRRKMAVAVAVVLAAGVVAAGASLASPNRYGPVPSDGCRLAYPMPDAIAKVFIQAYVKKLAAPGWLGSPNHNVFTGDTIVICNGSLCVDYVKSDTGDWEGTSPRQQVIPPRPGGGGGGGQGGGNNRPGGGYSGPIGGGGGGGGTGTGTVTVGSPVGAGNGSGSVTVGAPQPDGPPTHEN